MTHICHAAIPQVKGRHSTRHEGGSRTERRPRGLDVPSYLGDERVDGLEALLTAEAPHEADPGPLAVQVAVEVEQVGLEQRRVSVRVEGRAPAEADGGR